MKAIVKCESRRCGWTLEVAASGRARLPAGCPKCGAPSQDLLLVVEGAGLIRDDRERLGTALMAYKANLSREAVTAPDLAEYNEVEAGEVDDLAKRLGATDFPDYFQAGYSGPKPKPAPRRAARRAR